MDVRDKEDNTKDHRYKLLPKEARYDCEDQTGQTFEVTLEIVPGTYPVVVSPYLGDLDHQEFNRLANQVVQDFELDPSSWVWISLNQAVPTAVTTNAGFLSASVTPLTATAAPAAPARAILSASGLPERNGVANKTGTLATIVTTEAGVEVDSATGEVWAVRGDAFSNWLPSPRISSVSSDVTVRVEPFSYIVLDFYCQYIEGDAVLSNSRGRGNGNGSSPAEKVVLPPPPPSATDFHSDASHNKDSCLEEGLRRSIKAGRWRVWWDGTYQVLDYRLVQALFERVRSL